jgi:hypothetical protein
MDTITIKSRRQLDLYVARKVMEWEKIPTDILVNMGWSPTGNDEHAMIVFRKMCSVGDPWDLLEPCVLKDKIGTGWWDVWFNSCDGGKLAKVSGPDFGVTVCLCALKLMGVNIEFDEEEPPPRRYMSTMEAVGHHYDACVAAVGSPGKLSECDSNMLFSHCAKWLSKRGFFYDAMTEAIVKDRPFLDPLKVMLCEIESRMK